ncbi:unnamed protein product [Prunus armeniaca]
MGFKRHPSVTCGGFGSNSSKNLMMKRTIDERENKLIFLNPVLIVGIGDERRRRRITFLGLRVGNAWRGTWAATIDIEEQEATVKNGNNLSKPGWIVIKFEKRKNRRWIEDDKSQALDTRKGFESL